MTNNPQDRKDRTNISVKRWVLDDARRKGINISEICETALIQELGTPEVTGWKCSLCGLDIVKGQPIAFKDARQKEAIHSKKEDCGIFRFIKK